MCSMINGLLMAFDFGCVQVGMGGDHRTSHSRAHVRQPADRRVRLGRPSWCAHQAQRPRPVVGTVRLQHLALLLLQCLHPTHCLAPPEWMRHHPSRQAPDTEAEHRHASGCFGDQRVGRQQPCSQCCQHHVVARAGGKNGTQRRRREVRERGERKQKDSISEIKQFIQSEQIAVRTFPTST